MLERLAKIVWLGGAGLLAVACGERGATRDVPPVREPLPEAKRIELAPHEDRERSPYTGWTRAHYEAVFARVLLGFVDHRSPGGARTRYEGGERLPAAMEGATRMLPALGAWLACPCNPDRIVVEGRELDVADIARTIITTGTDPTSPDYWYPSRGGWDQREVEAASVAEFLVRSRARIWERLTAIEQQRILAWLEPAEVPLAANWLAFQVARNSARAALGRSVTEQALREQLDRLERDYAGDGFYRDGHRQRFDWYNAFVVHAELSFWRSVAGAAEPERSARVARRTQAFLAHFPYLFDAQGRVAPIGRSLAYRSAVLAGLHASVLAGDGFIEPGLARRISAGNLRFHLEAGMFGPGEVLTCGYHGEQPGVLEDYLRPGSQYFFTRALSVLALPPDHEFWTAKEQPIPADLGDFVHAIPAVGWMIEYNADGAGLVLHNAGVSTTRPRHHDKYAKLGYPAQTWFAQASEASRPYDAAIVSATKGRFSRRRSRPEAWAVAPGFAWQRYAIAPESGRGQPHWISTATLVDPAWVGGGSLRLSCVEPSSVEAARAYEGSYAIALGSTPRILEGERWAYLDSGVEPPEWGAGAVLLAGLAGWERVGLQLDHPAAAAHVLGGAAGYLGLGLAEAFDRKRCFASMQTLAAEPFDPEPILAAAPTVEIVGTQAWIEDWAGTRAWVELAPEPVERSVELGGLRATGPLRLLWAGPREGGLRVVAVGLRSLADAEGVVLEAGDGALSIVACDLNETRVRCELDGPARVRRPSAKAVQWVELPVERGEAGGVIVELGARE